MKGKLLLVTMATMLVAACGGSDGGIDVTEIRMGQPTGPNAALYFVATNNGDTDDFLVGATTDVASAVEIHETTMGDDGSTGMQPVESLAVSAGGSLELEPGGYHLMLVDVERMEVGDTVDITLTWEKAGEMAVKAEVVDPADTMGDMDMGDEDEDG